jgi:hypothetical protein
VKLSDLTPEEWYARLNRIAEQRRYALQWWQYMDLEQPLVYVARIIAEQDGRFPPLLLPWSELVVQSVVERLSGSSRSSSPEKPVEELDKSWQDNDLDELSDEAHTAMQVGGLHFLMVGPDGPGGSRW